MISPRPISLMERLSTSAVVLLCTGLAFGQSAKWKADVPIVQGKGLHAITLSTELLGASLPGFGDLRLLDSMDKEVPYVIEEVIASGGHEHFEPYTLLRNEALRYSTMIELERPAGEDTEELHIWIRPTQVEKRVRITGSDDRKRWYMVKDDHVVAQGAHGDPPHQVLLVDIPRSDYRYLRIALNDSLTPPMKVMGVGRFISGLPDGPRYQAPLPLGFVQTDGGGTSTLRIERSTPVLIERLNLEVSDTGVYRRHGTIKAWRTEVVGRLRKQHAQRVGEQQGSFVLTSDAERSMETARFSADSFDVVIDNGDDRPLRFTSISVAARQRVLLAYLEPDMRYTLVTGDTQLSAPHYDLAHFADELPVPLDTAQHGPLMPIIAVQGPGPAFDPSRWWIWAAIFALMLGMGLMAMRMLRKH